MVVVSGKGTAFAAVLEGKVGMMAGVHSEVVLRDTPAVEVGKRVVVVQTSADVVVEGQDILRCCFVV